jgi:hypothetical protein
VKKEFFFLNRAIEYKQGIPIFEPYLKPTQSK